MTKLRLFVLLFGLCCWPQLFAYAEERMRIGISAVSLGFLPTVLAEKKGLYPKYGLLAEHVNAFRDPLAGDGSALRHALHARLSRLFRHATLDPAAAFIFLAISALDFERLRGEILRRVAFPRLPLAA